MISTLWVAGIGRIINHLLNFTPKKAGKSEPWKIWLMIFIEFFDLKTSFQKRDKVMIESEALHQVFPLIFLSSLLFCQVSSLYFAWVWCHLSPQGSHLYSWKSLWKEDTMLLIFYSATDKLKKAPKSPQLESKSHKNILEKHKNTSCFQAFR